MYILLGIILFLALTIAFGWLFHFIALDTYYSTGLWWKLKDYFKEKKLEKDRELIKEKREFIIDAVNLKIFCVDGTIYEKIFKKKLDIDYISCTLKGDNISNKIFEVQAEDIAKGEIDRRGYFYVSDTIILNRDHIKRYVIEKTTYEEKIVKEIKYWKIVDKKSNT